MLGSSLVEMIAFAIVLYFFNIILFLIVCIILVVGGIMVVVIIKKNLYPHVRNLLVSSGFIFCEYGPSL